MTHPHVRRYWLRVAFVAAMLTVCAAAQLKRGDALAPSEAEQLQDNAGRADKRIALLLQFAQLRLTQFEQIRTESPRPIDRDSDLYSHLEQYSAIVQELDNNIDDMMQQRGNSLVEGKVDINKVLDEIIQAEGGMIDALHHIQTASSPADLSNYHFVLDDCVDVTNDSLQNAHEERTKPKPKSGGGGGGLNPAF